MIHRRKGRKLKRTASHKKALLSNLSISLIKHKRIETTQAKAKELRVYFEPLITKAKKAYGFRDSEPEKNVHLRRIARRFVKDKEALIILFDEIAPKIGNRPGGYTRVLKTGRRLGDGAETAIIELVDFTFDIKAKLDKANEEKTDKKSKGKEKEAEAAK